MRFLAMLVVGGVTLAPGNEAWSGQPLNLPTVPAQVTTLRVSAATDTSLVLSWTEVPTGSTAIARYAIRYSAPPLTWAALTDVTVGGCAAPVYGSTAGGGRIRSCVLSGLQPNVRYAVQLIAYTGTLNLNAVFGPLSNIVEATTAQRIGSMLVLRPRLFLDTVGAVRSIQVGSLGSWRWPLNVGFFVGDYPVTFRDSLDTTVAHGYLLIVKP